MNSSRALSWFIVLFLVLAIGGTAWWFHRYLHSPEFQVWVKQEASRAAGVPVEFDALDVALTQGIQLTNLRLENTRRPEVGTSSLRVQEIVLSYDWLSLLSRIFKITRLDLTEPKVIILQDPQGRYIMPYQIAAAPTTSSGATSSGSTNQSSSNRLTLEWNRLGITRGAMTIVGSDRIPRIQISGFNVTAQRNTEKENKTPGLTTGQIAIESLRLVNRLTFSRLQLPYQANQSTIQSNNFQATAYSGKTTGAVQFTFGTAQKPYAAQLNTEGWDVNALLAEMAGIPNHLSGRLYAQTSWSGSGTNLSALSGKGTLELRNGQMLDVPIFAVLAQILNIPELAKPVFDTCNAKFTAANQLIQWESIQLRSPFLELASAGTTSFNGALNLNIRMALHPNLTKQMPSMLLNRMTQREDGYRVVTFRVTGTLAQPNLNDLYQQLIVAPGGLLDQGVQRLQNLLQ